MPEKIVVISTGGTIAMGYDSARGGLAPLAGGADLVRDLPESARALSVEVTDFSNLPSSHMAPALILELAETVEKSLQCEDVAGVVITHGTDTLEESAFFLDLCLDSPKPVCFTAAMRGREEPGADGPGNLAGAMLAALSEEARGHGVLVVMNDEIHAARTVMKTHTGSVNAFSSPFWGPLGHIDAGQVIMSRKQLKRLCLKPRKLAENVPIIKVYTGMDDSLFSFLLDKGVSGLIVEGFGRGNVPPSVLPALFKILGRGIPVVLCSRVQAGRTLGVYGYDGGGVQLKDAGVIFSGELSSQKARLQLMLALGAEKNMDELHEIFES